MVSKSLVMIFVATTAWGADPGNAARLPARQ